MPSGHEFLIEGFESILEAGLRGGLALDYGCSNGNCGKCKCKVVSGQVKQIERHDYVLTEAEKGLGYVLACRKMTRSSICSIFLTLTSISWAGISKESFASLASSTKSVTAVLAQAKM